MSLLSSLAAIQYFTATDPYFYTIDNRPLADLRDNIEDIANYIDNGDKGWIQRVISKTSSGGVVTLDDTHDLFYVDLTENVTSIVAPTSADGKQIRLAFKQHASSAFTVAPGASFKLAGGAYTMTATNSKIDILTFNYISAFTGWFEVSRTQNM
jgi:hypothetical protein